MLYTIKCFKEQDEIKLLRGQLGYWQKDETLYIGIEEDPGYKAISSEEAVIKQLKEQIEKLGSHVENIFVELNERESKLNEILKKAKDVKDIIHEVIKDEKKALDTKSDGYKKAIDDESARLDKKIDDLEASFSEKIEKVESNITTLDEKVDSKKDLIITPSYKHLNSNNYFADSTSWIVDRDGYVLIEVGGLGSFRLLIDNVPVITKKLSEDPNDPTIEENFTQIFQVKENSKVEYDVIKKITDIKASCKFLPYEILDLRRD